MLTIFSMSCTGVGHAYMNGVTLQCICRTQMALLNAHELVVHSQYSRCPVCLTYIFEFSGYTADAVEKMKSASLLPDLPATNIQLHSL